jgi:hypothetical protein
MFAPAARLLAALAPESSSACPTVTRAPMPPVERLSDDLPVIRLRCSLAIAARSPGDERHLRAAVREFVLAERASGALVERVIIALKTHIRETVVVPRGDPLRDAITSRLVAWCIDDYYHLPR